MELQIQDLLSSIRKDGIDAANAEAASIIEDAKKKADVIISNAKSEANDIKAASEKEIEILKESAIVSAEHAKRDAMLSFKEEIRKEYEKILAVKVQKALSGASLETLIKAVLQGEDVSKYAAEVAEVSDSLKQALAEEIRNGLEIRPTKNVQAGFHIAEKDGSGYFDCSDEEVMRMLMPYFRNLDF